MVNSDKLYIVNYCHPNCIPLNNIMRLPKDEAFALAYKMSEQNSGMAAFWRFADFDNYYPLRLKQDEYLYKCFISLGGEPKVEHPLSFVLQGSEYLHNWFDNGIITKIMLKDIPSKYISFTYGDSAAILRKTDGISVLTKQMLLQSINEFKGTIDEYINEIVNQHYYIEVQLWNDNFCKCIC